MAQLVVVELNSQAFVLWCTSDIRGLVNNNIHLYTIDKCTQINLTTTPMATCSTPEQETHEIGTQDITGHGKEVAEPKESVSEVEQDFDFVEQPDQDLYCPITLEILLEPHQTDCCGQHISEKAAKRMPNLAWPRHAYWI